MTIKDLQKGEFFTLKPIRKPDESQVFIKGDYDRTEKKYECTRFSDFCSTRLLNSNTVVYTDFIFYFIF